MSVIQTLIDVDECIRQNLRVKLGVYQLHQDSGSDLNVKLD
jgi:hypothetical protein